MTRLTTPEADGEQLRQRRIAGPPCPERHCASRPDARGTRAPRGSRREVRIFNGIAAGWLAVLALCAATAGSSAEAAVRVDSVAISGSDLDRLGPFYTEVLGFRKVSEVEVWGEAYERLYGTFGLRMRVERLALGEEAIELREFLSPQGLPVPADSRSNDRWFQHVAIIVSDMDAAYGGLRSRGVRHASTGPQRLPDWNPNAGGIEAFYFKDPDGHPLEILAFPPGKGAPRWQSRASLFLGIDHTAIVVEGTPAGLAFYRDGLGLAVAGESENHGTEQEHLNNVFGARLRITALRGDAGPGVEFLEYLAPGDGREAPARMSPADLAATETTFVVEDAERTSRRLREAGGVWVSPGAVATPGRELGFARGAVLRDPDGHFIRLIEKE